jgi:hypothetical protein
VATRTQRLDRLVIQSPCAKSWEAMGPGGSARFCLHCDQHVHDLAALEAREIEALVEATRGRFCARITRDAAGRLITRQPAFRPRPAPPVRRASPAAAAVVGALVGLSGAVSGSARAQSATVSAAATVQPAAAAVPVSEAEVAASTVETAGGGARLTGQVAEPDEAYPVELEASFGIIVPVIDVEPPLREAVAESSLVVLATVGSSVETGTIAEGEARELRTELSVQTVLKGAHRGRTLTVTRFVEPGATESLAPGTTLLALLTAGEEAEGHRGTPTWVAADPLFGFRPLPDEALRSYRHRIEALVRVEQAPRPAARPKWLAATAEWLVATAEDEHTRKEAVDQLQAAVEAFAEEIAPRADGRPVDAHAVADELLAEGIDEDGTIDPVLLGAVLTDRHKDRLRRALLATERLDEPDLELFELVRLWADDEALRWLVGRFLEQDPATHGAGRQAMLLLADEVEGDGDDEADEGVLAGLLAAADAQYEGLTEQLDEEALLAGDTAEMERYEARAAEIEQELWRRFRAALRGRL